MSSCSVRIRRADFFGYLKRCGSPWFLGDRTFFPLLMGCARNWFGYCAFVFSLGVARTHRLNVSLARWFSDGVVGLGAAPGDDFPFQLVLAATFRLRAGAASRAPASGGWAARPDLARGLPPGPIFYSSPASCLMMWLAISRPIALGTKAVLAGMSFLRPSSSPIAIAGRTGSSVE